MITSDRAGNTIENFDEFQHEYQPSIPKGFPKARIPSKFAAQLHPKSRGFCVLTCTLTRGRLVLEFAGQAVVVHDEFFRKPLWFRSHRVLHLQARKRCLDFLSYQRLGSRLLQEASDRGESFTVH